MDGHNRTFHSAHRGIVNYDNSHDLTTPYTWSGNSIARMITKPEYMGHTVNFCTSMESYMDKRAKEKPKDKDKFYESHRRELTLYEAAERYIKGVLNGREKIPLPTWKTERERLTAERKRLNTEYISLKEEVGKVEKIARSVQDILHDERRREQPTHKRVYRADL